MSLSDALGFDPASALGATAPDIAAATAEFEASGGFEVDGPESPSGSVPTVPLGVADAPAIVPGFFQRIATGVRSFISPEAAGGLPLGISAVGMGAALVAPVIGPAAAAASLFVRGITALGGTSRGAGQFTDPLGSPGASAVRAAVTPTAAVEAAAFDAAASPDFFSSPEVEPVPIHQTLLPGILEGLQTVGAIVDTSRQIFGGTSVAPATASAYISPTVGPVYGAGTVFDVRAGGAAGAIGVFAATAAGRAVAFLRTRGFTVKRFKQLIVLVGLTAAAEIVGLSLQDAAIIATKRTRRRTGITASQLATTRKTLRRFKSLDAQIQDACKRRPHYRRKH